MALRNIRNIPTAKMVLWFPDYYKV